MNRWIVGLTCAAVGAVSVACLGADEVVPGDPDADKATHVELAPLEIPFKKLSALRMHPDGRLLAGDEEAQHIKVIDAEGQQVGTIKLPFGPESINVAEDGTIYCGGEGQVAMLSAAGELLKQVPMPEEPKAADPSKKGPPPRTRNQRVSGLAVSADHVFAARGSSWSLRSTSNLFRFDRQLENPQLIMEDIRGCCQRCDIVTREGKVFVAENSRHRVVVVDADGTQIATFGGRSREGVEGFGACCNPMNLCFDEAGSLYTSESGLGRLKRYSIDGEMLDLVGYVDTTRFTKGSGLAASCSNMAIAVTPDAHRIYVMDYKHNRIRVLVRKSG